MLVEKIMSENVNCISPDDEVGKLRDILSTASFHHLLVEENKRLVGVISDRDISVIMSPFFGTKQEQESDAAQLKIKVAQIMSTNLVTVEKDTSIDCAAILLLENNISCLPIVTSELAIAGILTWKDILEYYVYANLSLT